MKKSAAIAAKNLDDRVSAGGVSNARGGTERDPTFVIERS